MNNFNALPNHEYKRLSFEDVSRACTDLAITIKSYEAFSGNPPFDAIVGVARGGLIPATILSYTLNKPLIPLSYSSTKGKGNDKNHNNIIMTVEYNTLLIVDDICDTGHTLQEVSNAYKEFGCDTKTVVIIDKHPNVVNHEVGFSWLQVATDYPWVIFPWEDSAVNRCVSHLL